MKLLRKNIIMLFLFVESSVFFATSMIIANIDTFFYFRWIAFSLHIFSILILLYIYISKRVSKPLIKKIFSKKEIIPILIILFVVAAVNFLFLSIYPYVSMSDELRDGGIYAMKIASGSLKNIFAYGAYNAHGLIIPTLTIPFYYIFGNSTLSYRFPSALLSSLDVILIYVLIRLVANKQIALLSAIILATLPLHMFFAHTQVVVAFNFFWVPLILLLFFYLLKQHRFIDYIFLGTILGFTSGFHAAVRVFSVLIFFLLFFLELKEMIMKKFRLEDKIVIRFTKLILFICFIFVGFGPRLFFTSPQDFFHTSRFTLESKLQSNTSISIDDLKTMKRGYIKSIMAYIYESTTYFFPEHKPIFSPFLSLFFVLGVGYSFFVLKNYFINILLFILVALPFFNSAITDVINADHRLSPLFSIGSVFVAIGISYCLKAIKNKVWKYLFGVIIVLYLTWQVASFYINQPANKNFELKDYLLTHALYFLQTDKQYKTSPSSYLQYMKSGNIPNQVCLFVSPSNYRYFNNNFGIQEQQQFFLPSATIQFMERGSINDNELYIVKSDCKEEANYAKAINTFKISCSRENKFTCPLNYSGFITIHY